MADDSKNYISKFDCLTEPATLGTRWKRWLNAFELYADGKGLIIQEDKDDNKQRRRALLLHFAGPDVQDIFSTLPDTGTVKDYEKAVTALNNYFVPKVNTAYARHTFRQLTQKPGETIQQFVTRLRSASKDCGYGTDTDNHIRDEILTKCTSSYLRRKLLEEGETLTLTRTLEIANQCEKIEAQMIGLGEKESVNRVTDKGRRDQSFTKKEKREKTPGKSTGGQCYRCGNTGHFGRDPKCPARGKTCRKCGGKDHFQRACKSRDTGANGERQVNQVQGNCEYAFHVSGDNASTVSVSIGGVNLDMLVDSGATSNIIGEETWEKLKAQGIKCTSSAAPSGKKLYAYASDKPLSIKGSFNCDVKAGCGVTQAEFLVIKGKGIPLLGRDTAIALGTLKVGIDVATVSEKEVQTRYPEVFSGVGKLKSRQVTLHVDPNVKPIAQPPRRIPFNIRDQVSTKIKELLDNDIIEPVEGPTPWVNPVVVVPKAGGEIRLCIDMRRANEAIIRTRYNIPTVDELLQNMNGSKIFSKLDLRWGYHQLELSPESRGITTFATHEGLYQYKRLLFGVSSASEIYQHEISAALAGIEGAENISDDIIVHAPDQNTHDKRLREALQRLHDSNLTLNAEKCVFNMDRLVFMGMLLSEKGVGPTEERVQAILETREPENVTELRSFLGLANYSSRFIPHFATLTEPLRRLTKKDVPYVFGPEQKTAFRSLKESMAKAGTLAYFDKMAPTKIIADASPVGLGAVLLQEQDGQWTPVYYASRSLTQCEQKYSQTEKEALALVWSCERLHPYIYGIRFDLETDHKPLEVIYGRRSKPCARIERWVLRLQPYDFHVVYVPGKTNIADPLSRLLNQNPKPGRHDHGAEEYVRFIAVKATPNALSTREIEEASAADEELIEVRRAIQTGRFDNCKQYGVVSGELCVIGQLVLRGTRIVIPSKLRPQVLALAHEGHLGIVGTKQNLRTKVWWPGIDKAAERHCKGCRGCQLVARPDPPEPLRPTRLPDGPWQDVACDLLGPLPSGHSLLVTVDYYSRYYEVSILQSTTTEKIIDHLDEIFSRFGFPMTLKSDNGPQFISEEFRHYCEQNGITQQRVTAKWAQANGEVERQNRSIMKRLKIAQAEGQPWKAELRKYLRSYRSLPHTTTGRSPAELLFNRKMKGKIPDLSMSHVYDQEVFDRDAEQKATTKAYADTRRAARPSTIDVGDQVLVKQDKHNKLTTTFNPVPHTVISKNGNSTVVQSPSGAQYSRNTSHIKKYTPDISEQEKEVDMMAKDRMMEDTKDTMEANLEGPEPEQRPQRARTRPKRFDDYIMG